MNNIKYGNFVIAFILLLLSFDASAAVWNKETKGTFELSGDYTITSQITLTGDLTLTLPADATSDVIITNKAGTTSFLFSTNNRSLTIKSLSDTYKVILDGGAIWEEYTGSNNNYKLAQQYACSARAGSNNVGMSHYSLISGSGGGLILDNVVLRNNFSTYANGGGAISFVGAMKEPVEIKNVIINACSASCSDGGGGAIIFKSSSSFSHPINLSNCEIFDCTLLNDKYGGIIRTNGKTGIKNLNLDSCVFHHNYAYPAHIILWNVSNGLIKMSGCEMYNNYTPGYSIAVFESSAEITNSSFHNNTCSGSAINIAPWGLASGGDWVQKNIFDANTSIFNNNCRGIAVTVSKGPFSSVNMSIELNGTKIYNNETTVAGAGVAFTKESSIGASTKYMGHLVLNGAEIYGNTTTSNGGGIYFSGYCETEIKGGTILGKPGEGNANQAKLGGGIYAVGGKCTIEDCTIENNIATGKDSNNGAGGALYISGSNVDVRIKEGSVIKSNKALQGNGGAFYIGGGSTSVEGGKIEHNEAVSGAGLYVNGGVVSFTSGEVGSNIASGNGGGLFVNGGSIEFSANLDGNTAANGGGLYLASGAEMTFAGGVISKNKAVASESATATTAYHGGSGIQGCGGGIYLQSGPSSSKKTTLLFDFPEGMRVMGLYSNEADKAGAEIVAEGGNTEVQLPAISEMQLAGFEGQDASPYWYQDYFTGDTGFYQSGGHAVAGEVTTVDRFKNIMKLIGTQYLEHRIPETRLPEIVNNYLCLTLSFSMLNITLKATGLLGHETAMFKLIRHGTDQNTTFDILLRADDGASKTLRNMPWGTYSVIPNNSWNYEYSPVQSKDNIRVGETDHYVIEYNMEHRNSAVMPQHDERQIGGKDVPSSSVSGSVPEKYSGKEL